MKTSCRFFKLPLQTFFLDISKVEKLKCFDFKYFYRVLQESQQVAFSIEEGHRIEASRWKNAAAENCRFLFWTCYFCLYGNVIKLR